MKSLNTVIEVLESCQNAAIECFECPMRHETECEVKSVALAYLKEYQSAKDELDEKRLKYMNAIAELEDNPPLTWDELKGMEGKPVWIEYNLDSKFDTVRNDSKIWGIIGNIQNVYYDRAYHNWLRMAIWADETFLFAEEGLGMTWQAYRKERK